ncbi:MAG TPA: hypothetical protein VKC56_06960 [Gallionellaceae bacterium]|nr:hypothetical protein [Gallionellaceae bacterium]
MAAPDATPQKIKITPELIAEWTRDAGVLLDANCSKAGVIRDLRSRGCTPKLAEQIVAKAKGPVRSAHRVLGMRAVFIGAGMILLGWVLSLFLHHSWRAWEIMAGGGAVAAVGGFKLLTGSAVDLDRVNRPQDYVE